MKYRTVFLDEAQQDMDDIEKHLSQFYPSTARRFFDKLKKKVANLETMPYMYPAYEADPFFRRMIIDDYLLFYSVDEKRPHGEKPLVVIHRIFHTKRDVCQQILEHRTYK